MYLITNKIIPAETLQTVELLAEKSNTFDALSLQILATEEYSNKESFVEICDITVLGEPQLVNNNGVINIKSRGNSLTFDKETPLNFSIFGSSAGQGLSINVVNPHQKNIKVDILIKGKSGDENLLGRSVENSLGKYLFNHFNLKACSITKIPLNNINRYYSKFKCTNFQLLSFKSNNNEIAYPIIKNIIVNGESQIENLEDVDLNSKFFKELKSFEMKEFPSHSKGTYITLENPFDYELNCYMTMLG